MIVGRRFASLSEVPEGVLTADMNGGLSIGLAGGHYKVDWEALVDNEFPGVPLDYLIEASDRECLGGYVEIEMVPDVVEAEVVGMSEPQRWDRLEDIPVGRLVVDSDPNSKSYYWKLNEELTRRGTRDGVMGIAPTFGEYSNTWLGTFDGFYAPYVEVIE